MHTEAMGAAGVDKKALVKESLFNFITSHVPNADLSAIDEIILSYVYSAMDIAPSDFFAHVTDFMDIVSAYVTDFSKIDQQSVYSWMKGLVSSLDENKEPALNGVFGEPVIKMEEDKENVISFQSINNAVVERDMKQSRCNSSSEDVDDAMSSNVVIMETEDMSEQIEVLQEMFPNTAPIEIKHCVSIAHGEIDGAIATLLHRRDQGQALVPAALHPANNRIVTDDLVVRTRIIDRYSYVDREAESKEHRPVPLPAEPRKLVRYRDNKIVSLKGERFTENRRHATGQLEIWKPKVGDKKPKWTDIRLKLDMTRYYMKLKITKRKLVSDGDLVRKIKIYLDKYGIRILKTDSANRLTSSKTIKICFKNKTVKVYWTEFQQTLMIKIIKVVPKKFMKVTNVEITRKTYKITNQKVYFVNNDAEENTVNKSRANPKNKRTSNTDKKSESQIPRKSQKKNSNGKIKTEKKIENEINPIENEINPIEKDLTRTRTKQLKDKRTDCVPIENKRISYEHKCTNITKQTKNIPSAQENNIKTKISKKLEIPFAETKTKHSEAPIKSSLQHSKNVQHLKSEVPEIKNVRTCFGPHNIIDESKPELPKFHHEVCSKPPSVEDRLKSELGENKHAYAATQIDLTSIKWSKIKRTISPKSKINLNSKNEKPEDKQDLCPKIPNEKSKNIEEIHCPRLHNIDPSKIECSKIKQASSTKPKLHNINSTSKIETSMVKQHPYPKVLSRKYSNKASSEYIEENRPTLQIDPSKIEWSKIKEASSSKPELHINSTSKIETSEVKQHRYPKALIKYSEKESSENIEEIRPTLQIDPSKIEWSKIKRASSPKLHNINSTSKIETPEFKQGRKTRKDYLKEERSENIEEFCPTIKIDPSKIEWSKVKQDRSKPQTKDRTKKDSLTTKIKTPTEDSRIESPKSASQKNIALSKIFGKPKPKRISSDLSHQISNLNFVRGVLISFNIRVNVNGRVLNFSSVVSVDSCNMYSLLNFIYPLFSSTDLFTSHNFKICLRQLIYSIIFVNASERKVGSLRWRLTSKVEGERSDRLILSEEISKPVIYFNVIPNYNLNTSVIAMPFLVPLTNMILSLFSSSKGDVRLVFDLDVSF